MVKLAGTLSHFQSFTALVVGDFMLDTYTTGRVKRISPEAPVPVMEVQRIESRPGGAGNVVLSLIALGAKVIPFGRIGADNEGMQLQQSLTRDGVDLQALLVEDDYQTPIKNRLIADSQQLLRVDLEVIRPISASFEEKIIDQLRQLIPQAKVIALSDYGKGFLTPSLIARIISLAKSAKIPIIVDPKGADFRKYKGATVLKPNQSAAYAAAQMEPDASLDAVAERILEISDVDLLLITRSEAGISLFDRQLTRRDFPVRSREVKDVTGAGDTVLAVLSAALANRLDVSFAAQLANIAAGIAIERLGCVQVTISELACRLLEFDTDTKIFDDSHTFALRQVLKDKSYSLLVLPKGQKMCNALFRTLRQLQKNDEEELIVYVRGGHPDDEFIHFLSSLQEVDYIILQSESLKVLCESIRPREIYFLEDGKLSGFDSPQTMLAAL
jgi:D-beta-D-heptose 7-phosphate kinase/D-beta-D-heptose 1-phosphate adenosyltransferase